MNVISDLKMILDNASVMCITDAKTYTEQMARYRDVQNYVRKIEFDRAYSIRDFANKLQRRFRSEYEEMVELEMEDCINWADWLDATAQQILTDMKKG